jgi:hypothetical protein
MRKQVQVIIAVVVSVATITGSATFAGETSMNNKMVDPGFEGQVKKGLLVPCGIHLRWRIRNTELDGVVKAVNSNSSVFPTLSFRESPPMVCAEFEGIQGHVGLWCYESPVELVSAVADKKDQLVLRHKIRKHPNVLLVTTVKAEPEAIELVVRPQLISKDKKPMPEAWEPLNMCFTMINSPDFANLIGEPYQKFADRCFVFTEKDMTFLNRTARNPLQMYEPNHPCNNPPWTQSYFVGEKAEKPGWKNNGSQGVSNDLASVPLLGVVSRDGKHLAAVANDTAEVIHQAWLDCMHANPAWRPAGAIFEKQTCRVKVYVMKNDPQALLKRFAKDFPKAMGTASQSTR